MAEKLNLNAVQTQQQRSPPIPDTLAKRRGADTLVIRFEVDDSLDVLPPSLQDLEFEAEQGMAEACEGKGQLYCRMVSDAMILLSPIIVN